jgi:hypothetical protein
MASKSNASLQTVPTGGNTVVLKPNQIYTALYSDKTIVGSTGIETVLASDFMGTLNVSGSIDNLNLSNSVFNYIFRSNASGALIQSIPGALLLNIDASTAGMHVNFGDKSSLTMGLSASGSLQMHFDKVQLTANLNLTLPNSDITVWGSVGKETVNIPNGVSRIACDANVENVKLNSLSYDANLLTGTPGGMMVSDSSKNTILNWSIGSNVETLYFSNAIGTLSTNSVGLGQFKLTDLMLNSNQSYTLNQSAVRVYGANGSETVTLGPTARQGSVDPYVEKVVFPGKLSDYTWSSQGTSINFYDASKVNVVNIAVQWFAQGTSLQFADQSAKAIFKTTSVLLTSPTGQVLTSGAGAQVNSTSSGTSSASTTSSASNFNYSLDWSGFSGYASQLSSIQTCLTAALNKMATYLNVKGVLDIKVMPENVSSNVLAEASGAMVGVPSSLVASSKGASVTTEFLAESQTGLDMNGSLADATIYINMANYARFNLNPNQSPSSTQFDLTSVLSHELLHALAFDGNYGYSTQKTIYDTYISMINGSPYFTGAHAQSIYGGPVPIASSSAGAGSAYYHVKVSNDLMSDALGAGLVRSISALDLAMLQDMGVSIVGQASA